MLVGAAREAVVMGSRCCLSTPSALSFGLAGRSRRSFYLLFSRSDDDSEADRSRCFKGVPPTCDELARGSSARLRAQACSRSSRWLMTAPARS